MLMPLTDVERLDEIPGVGPATAQVILAEIGTDMSVFPTADHLASWARLSPRTFQSGPKNTSGPPAKATPGCAEPSAKQPSPPPAPTPSSAPATAASSNAEVTSRPWSPSPAPSWSWAGTS
ncbi:IS110 family transposase [Streptomyces sp. NPDC006476]|uniref:IS110 family transposase n=1 Tax=Streptomyces sp. NPDC006476 TaxID=3157175 RepID=UPI0033A52052